MTCACAFTFLRLGRRHKKQVLTCRWAQGRELDKSMCTGQNAECEWAPRPMSPLFKRQGSFNIFLNKNRYAVTKQNMLKPHCKIISLSILCPKGENLNVWTIGLVFAEDTSFLRYRIVTTSRTSHPEQRRVFSKWSSSCRISSYSCINGRNKKLADRLYF